MKEIDPKRNILKLKPIRSMSFTLSPTERLTPNFLVSGDNLFVSNYYGPIEVYNTRQQKKVSTLHFCCHLSKSLACDGKHLYIGLPSNEIKPKNTDVLLARDIGNWEEGTELEGTTEFVGKTFKELDIPIEFDQNYARKYKLVVLSLPINEFGHDSIVWSPGVLAEERGKKLYIANMERLLDFNLSSGINYAVASWKKCLCHDLGWNSVHLREGEVLKEKQIAVQEKEDAFSKLWISRGHLGKGLEAKIEHWDESYESRDPDYVPISLVPQGGADILRGTTILDVQQERNLLYVLTDSCSDTSNGVTRVNSPHMLLTYQLSFQRITPVKKELHQLELRV